MKKVGEIEALASALYISPGARSGRGITEDRYIDTDFKFWHIVSMPEEDRQLRGAAAGLFIAKRAVPRVTELSYDEMAEVLDVINLAPQLLCDKAGKTFTGDFVWGFNNGPLAGQTQDQVHGHLYPVVSEDMPSGRNGMGAMQEANRRAQGK